MSNSTLPAEIPQAQFEITSKLEKCYYCEKLEESPRDGVCFDHRRCTLCTRLMDGAETWACLKNDAPPTHARCLIASRAKDGHDGVTVSREWLLNLNLARLLIMPEPGLNEESNVNAAALKTNTFIIDMTLEEQFLFMRRLESAAAEVSYLINKNRKSIKEALLKKSEERMVEVQNYRNAPKSVKPQAMGPSEPRIAKAKLTPREKAIAGLMGIGLSREQAEAAVPAI